MGLQWVCQGCGTNNQLDRPLELEVELPYVHTVIRGSQSLKAMSVVPATCSECGLVSFFDGDFVRAQMDDIGAAR